MDLIDAQANQTLWTKEYQRQSGEALLLQEQVAAHAADVLRCALISRRPTAGSIDSETLSLFLRACDQVQRFDGGPADMLGAANQLTQRAPGYSRGWSMLAMANAYASRVAPGARSGDLREAAAQAAERAEKLDASNGEALLAKSIALPLLGAWEEREALILEALEREPNSAQALLILAELYSEVGRIADALDLVRQSVAVDPLSPISWSAHIPLLAAVGLNQELEDVRERLHRTWPNSPSAILNRFSSAMYNGDYAKALAMMDAGAPAEQPLLRAYLKAGIAGDDAGRRQAARDIAAAARQGRQELPPAIAIASTTGELDEAFALADLHFERAGPNVRVGEPAGGAGRYLPFVLSTREMRRDPRFMTLMQKVGLLDYWHGSGVWPDFCSDPALRYDCRGFDLSDTAR
jgi:tetratricopeptide (TPR) repeat protein